MRSGNVYTMEHQAQMEVGNGRRRDRKQAPELDSYDISILSALLRESRTTVVDLAGMVHLSRPAVTRRIAALRDAGVLLSSGALISYEKIGPDISAIVELSTPSHSFASAEEYLFDRPEVLAVSTVSGSSTFVVDVIALNMKHLREFVRSLQVYGDTDTRIVFSRLKSSMPLTDRLKKMQQQSTLAHRFPQGE